MPLTFEENRGQVPAQYSYVLQHDGMKAKFFRDGVDFFLPGQKKESGRLRLELLSADRNAAPAAEEPLKGKSNYLLGSDSARWIGNVPNYARVRYQDIYPGISLVFYGTGNELEHDFTVAAGADPSSIAFQLQGSKKTYLSPDGDLEIHLDAGTLVLRKPVAYQTSAQGRDPVDANFLLAKDGSVRFRLGAYDSSRPLVIDPVFSFSTYLTGTGMDQVAAVTTDASGNVYLTGYTSSPDFPIQNAEQPQLGCNPPGSAGCQNAFVTKLDSTGKLIFSTYLGGSSQDYGAAIAVDASGDVIVAGTSESSNFPHAGAVSSPSCPINNNCYFVSSLKPDGSALNYSGLIGGPEGVYASGDSGSLAVDASGNAYLAGTTDSSNFQITGGTLATTVTGYPYSSTFVLKVDPTGKLLYSTVIPGNATSDPEQPYNNFFLPTGIAVDSSGQVTVAGTGGLGLPTTSGVVAATFPNNSTNVGNPSAGYIVQLNASASAINYGTYVPGTDTLGGMAVDSSGNLYVTGSTSETTLPVSANAYQQSVSPGPTGQYNAGFIVKLNPQATSVLAASYLTGTPINGGASFTGIALDSHSNVFVGGEVGTDFPLQDPFVSIWEYSTSAVDMVLAEMSPDLSSLTFGSYLSSTDGIFPGSIFSALAIDPSDNLVVAGTTFAGDFPTTSGSFEPQPPPPANPQIGTVHSFVSKINMAMPAPSFCPNTWSVAFGLVPAQTSSTQTLNVTNCGNAPLDFSTMTSSVPTISATQSCGSVAPGAVCPVTLTFSPTNSSAVGGTITFADNTAISPQVIQVAGQGQAPDLEPASNPLTFGHLLAGTQGPSVGLFVYNRGNAPLTIYNVSISGIGFSIVGNGCTGTWPAGYPCVIELDFSPPTAGGLSGSLTITSNDPVHPQLAVSLTGTGDSVYAAPVISSVGTAELTQQTLQINNGSVTLQVSGSNFYPASVVQVNGAVQQTTFKNNGLLQVAVSASSLTALGELPLMVVNPGPGGGTSAAVTLTPYQMLSLNTSYLVSVPATNLLYAAIPASSSSNPNTVIPIDPTTGTAETPIPVGNNPVLMAASSDGAYLYVALAGDQTVQRINLQTNAVERTFPYSPNPFCTFCEVLPATDLETVPGSPQGVVLAQGSMVSLYNDSGLVNYVPNAFVTYFAPSFNSIAFAGNPLALYALPFTLVQNSFFTTASIGNTGLQYTQISGTNYGGNNTTGGQVISDGTLLYTNSGEVWNPTNQTQVGSFPVSTLYNIPTDVTLDSTLSQLYVLGYGSFSGANGGYDAIAITSFGQKSLAIQNTLAFPQINSSVAGSLVRWGTNGFGFVVPSIFEGASGIYLTRSDALTGQVMPNSVPSVASMSPTATTAGASAFTLAVSGAGFISTSTVNWNGTALTTSYVSATQLTAVVPASGVVASGAAQVTVSTPTPGGGMSSALTFTINPAVPAAAVSGTTLGFGSITEGSSSPGQTVTVTNSGTAILSITSIAASGDFTETNTCGTTLAVNGRCQISVILTPTATGPRTGTLTIADNAVNGPQTVSLSGTGIAPVAIGTASGGSTSATVSSGGTANYNLSLTGSTGFSGTLALTCSGAPENASCTINPATLNLTPGNAANFTVTVTTTASQTASLFQNSRLQLAGFGLCSLFIVPLFQLRKRVRLVALCFTAVCVLLAITGCAGNGSGSPAPTSPNPAVTPAGTYTLTVTASTGGMAVTQNLTMTVQ